MSFRCPFADRQITKGDENNPGGNRNKSSRAESSRGYTFHLYFSWYFFQSRV